MEADERQDWEAYKQSGDMQAHERLCERYLPFVKRLVGRMEIYFGDGAMDKSDLVHAGVIGLIDAIEKYDPARSIEFAAYARQRIRGAVYDELRAMDGLSSRARRQKREMDKTRETLQNKLLRPPTDEETAEELGLSLERFRSLQAELETTRVLTPSSDDAEHDLVTYSDRPRMESMQPWVPDADGLSSTEKFKIISEKIDHMPDRVKMILGLYYKDSLTLKEIAEIMHLTESRICQIHAWAIEQLHQELSGLKKIFANR
jgi:RNA polymerase sigma factor for flagellar operon FliA